MKHYDVWIHNDIQYIHHRFCTQSECTILFLGDHGHCECTSQTSPPGLPGLAGTQGDPGIVGEWGQKGDQGEQGPRGLDGLHVSYQNYGNYLWQKICCIGSQKSAIL